MTRQRNVGRSGTVAPAVVEARRALRHEVVRLVLLEIFRGSLAPGSRLITQTLSRQMGISATPLREALVELEAIGMVEISHNRGAVVAAFGPAELRGIYQVRRVLEVEAIRCACGRIDRDVLQEFLAAMREYAARPVKSAAWLRAVMASDARLHATIAAAGDSPRLAKEIDRYALLLQTISEAIGNQLHSKEDGIREHIAIIEALVAEDPDRAALAMTRHIEATAIRALGVMFSEPQPRRASGAG